MSSACKGTEPRAGLCCFLREFLSLQHPSPHTPEKAAVLMASRPQQGLCPQGLCLPRRFPLGV